jgi:hypothetical protein
LTAVIFAGTQASNQTRQDFKHSSMQQLMVQSALFKWLSAQKLDTNPPLLTNYQIGS